MKVETMFIQPHSFLPNQKGNQTVDPKASFANSLAEAWQKANETIMQSEKVTAKLAIGEIQNIHDVTIAAQKAQIALQLTTQVRDKVVEAYQEVMRMQV